MTQESLYDPGWCRLCKKRLAYPGKQICMPCLAEIGTKVKRACRKQLRKDLYIVDKDDDE